MEGSADRANAFDPQRWRDAEEDGLGDLRYRMIPSLMRKHGGLMGMTEAEVVTLLGPPSTSGHFRPEWDLVYWLSPEHGFMSIDSDWLVIKLDDTGRVVRTDRVTD